MASDSPLFRFSAAALMVFVPFAAMAQETVALPVNTPVVVVTKSPLTPVALAPGDVVDLKLLRSLRAGTRLIVPADASLTGRVTAVQKKPLAIEMTMDPIVLPGGQSVAVTGNPLLYKKGKLVEQPEKMPKELDWYYRPSAGDIAALTGVGLVALPILAIASPFILFDSVHHDKKDEVLKAGHRAELHLVAPITLPVDALPEDKASYSGTPVIYLVDRLHQHHRRIFCGTDAFLGDHHEGTVLLRVEPNSYTFHTERKDEATATVTPVADGRYLVYHDHAGLHAVSLAERPELIDRLPAITEKTKYFFDVKALAPEQKAAVDRDRARGGCGLVKVLHSRSEKAQVEK